MESVCFLQEKNLIKELLQNQKKLGFFLKPQMFQFWNDAAMPEESETLGGSLFSFSSLDWDFHHNFIFLDTPVR